MAIKRYWATADNTITNAYLENLSTRATGSNMGASDILEVFSIYGQSATASVSNAASSSELSRFLIKFPVTGTNSIESDRTATTIPASGSVNFYLRMFNAPHSQTTPRAFYLSVSPVSASWQEGTGLDMFEYKDLVNGNIGSNWIYANGSTLNSVPTSATATIIGNASLDDASGTSLILVNADASTVTFTTDPTLNFGDVTADLTAAATATIIGNASLDDADGTSFKLVNADGEIITFTTDPTKNFGDTVDETASPFTVNTRDISGGSEVRKATQAFWIACKAAIDAGVLDMTISPTTWGDEEEFTLTQTTVGTDGNTAITLITGVTADGETAFTGGIGQRWRVNTEGISGGSEVRKATQAFWIACKGAIDAGELDMTISPTTWGDEEEFTLTQTTVGTAGNTAITLITGVTADGETAFTGGIPHGTWASPGGDYLTGSNYSVYFDKGTEDIELDITHLVEEWIDGTPIADYGIGVMITASSEASSSTNLTGSTNSYYTKKFFGRTSEYFFKRPYIEARWDSRTKDERGNIYFSSSLMTADENLNTIYFYNYFRGQLRNVPDLGTGQVYVSLFSGSSDDTEPSGDKLELHKDGTHVNDTSKTAMTGGYVSTGIYSASFCLTSSSAAPQTYYDVWWKATTEYHTGSFTATRLKASNYSPDPTYVTAITNLRPEYNRREKSARFRLFVREKDWSPTIYTKASTAISNTTIESASFRVHRVIDNLEVIPYGTGSTLHTLLSYDVSGNYLDLDMNVLEGGYAYGMNFAYYNGAVSQWVEQPETFKFRVEDVED